MFIIGCDLHSRYQVIAMLDTQMAVECRQNPLDNAGAMYRCATHSSCSDHKTGLPDAVSRRTMNRCRQGEFFKHPRAPGMGAIFAKLR